MPNKVSLGTLLRYKRSLHECAASVSCSPLLYIRLDPSAVQPSRPSCCAAKTTQQPALLQACTSLAQPQLQFMMVILPASGLSAACRFLAYAQTTRQTHSKQHAYLSSFTAVLRAQMCFKGRAREGVYGPHHSVPYQTYPFLNKSTLKLCMQRPVYISYNTIMIPHHTKSQQPTLLISLLHLTPVPCQPGWVSHLCHRMTHPDAG